MAEQQRAVPAVEVDIAVAIDVPFVGTLRAVDGHAVRLEVARIMRDAAREQIACLLRQVAEPRVL